MTDPSGYAKTLALPATEPSGRNWMRSPRGDELTDGQTR
jgi:hypothetical protein